MITKAFCIGFNKTGTSSIHRLFEALGLRSFHGYYSHIPVTDPLYREYQCFSDGDQHEFALLDATFPGSKFIVTTRPLSDWLVSRIRHVELRRSLGATGPMRQEYEANPALAVRGWAERRLAYHRRVVDYFAGRPDALLIVDLCTAADSVAACATVASFLGLPARDGLQLPHENAQRPEGSLPGVRGKAEVRAEVATALATLGIPPAEQSAVFP